jgi:hypothetical protein
MANNSYRPNLPGKIFLWASNVFLGIIFVFTIQYFKTEVFHKERNTPFSGENFYNPYKEYNSKTLKANFHVHSKSGGLSGDYSQVPEKIFEHYKKNGYDIVSLSDYQKITTDTSDSEYIGVYEHGYNLKKSHQLVINSEKPTYFDFSITGNYHTKQQVLNKLKQKGGLLVLAHPGLRNGYSEEDFKYLKGYDFIEVLNNYKVSEKIWDAALSNGYPAWIMANDDCHDITRSNLSFNNWTRISANNNTREEVLASLRRGSHYGVRNLNHIENNYLDSCILDGDEIRVYFSHPADRISFISDEGIMRKEVKNTNYASYQISDNDNYVRIESEKDEELIYLNPVIRYNGYQLNTNSGFGLVNTTMTIIARIGVLLINLSVLFLILILNGRFVIPGRFKTKSVKVPGEVALG